ncbi:MAG: hypothetical protein KF901_28580 [Myxococcales bacterium]|nr:hypothetical protein [Myxococcales bacterium]
MSEPGREPTHESPLVPNLVLWFGFLLVVVASIFTVLLPEILDDDPEDSAVEVTSAPADAE